MANASEEVLGAVCHFGGPISQHNLIADQGAMQPISLPILRKNDGRSTAVAQHLQ
jgi:hypothetical protein